MRKKMLLLALVLAATAASLTAPRAQAGLIGGGPFHACPQCTTFPDGTQCCIPCQCNDGGVMLCPDIGCAQVL
jgi:hypothetical protein